MMKALPSSRHLQSGARIQIAGETWCLKDLLKKNNHNQSWSIISISNAQKSFLKLASSPQSIAALRNEASVLKELNATFSPDVLAFEAHTEIAGLVTEWLEGVSLDKRLERGALPLQEVQSLGSSLWAVLTALHRAGIYHGDLKPEHVMVDDSKVRLCDFGFSYKDGEGAPLGVTPAYASPEKLGLLRRPLSESSELYSSGLLILESLTGTPTWPTLSELGRRLHLPSSLAHITSGPRSLPSFLERLLQTDPRSRYATVDAVAEDWKRLWEQPEKLIHLGLGDRRTTLTAPTLVGRQVELSSLESYLLQDSPRPQWISARSGRGKSHLLRSAVELARRQGRVVLEARGSAEKSGSRGVLHQWISSLVESSAPHLSEVLAKPQLQAALPILGRAFPELALPASAPTEAELNERTLCDALAQLLTALPDSLLLCLDDAQWADSLAHTFFTLDLPHNVKAFVAFREEEFSLPPSSDPLLQLRPLDPESCRQMLQSMSGPLPAEALTTITSRAQGEPFLLSALLLGAQEMGILQEDPAGWRWTPHDLLQTGLRAGQVLLERLRLCPEAERSLLEAGAVLGRNFSLAGAANIAEIDEERALSLQEGAIERQLLWRLEQGNCSFSHDKIREGLLAGLEPEEKRRLHCRAAIWHEGLTEPCSEPLAYHWTQADRSERAFPFACLAGVEAFSRLDYTNAIEHLRLALESTPASLETTLHFQLLNKLAQALDTSTLYEEALPLYHQALKVAPNAEEKVLVLGRMCLAYGRSSRPPEVGSVIEEGMRLLGDPMPSTPWEFTRDTIVSAVKLIWKLYRDDIPEPGHPDPAFQARIRFRLTASDIGAHQGRSGFLLWSLLKGCEELSRRSSPVDGSLIWANAGTIIIVLTGVDKIAARLFEQAQAAAGQNQRYLGQVLSQSGLLYLVRGDLVQAHDTFSRGVVISLSQGDRWNAETAQSYEALLDHALGRFASAAGKALKIWQRQTIEETNFFSSLVILAKCGQADEFESRLKTSTETKLPVMRIEFLSTFALGLVYLHKNQPAKALPYLRRACATMTPELLNWGASAPPWLATAWHLLAEQLPTEATALRKKALRQAARAVKLAQKTTGVWEMTQPHTLREHAIASVHAGRFYLARSLFQKSWELSERLQMAFESAWTLYERGKFAVAAGWKDWEGDQEIGAAQVRRLEAWLPGVDLTVSESLNPLAKLDRFDRVLEAGRLLVALEGKVLDKLAEQARILLRCDRVQILHPDSEKPKGWSESLYQRCLEEQRAVTEAEIEEPSRSLLLHEARSTLMAPVRMENSIVAILVAWQNAISGFFSEEETRLADYLCALAGAGLENERVLSQRDRIFGALQLSEQRFRGFFEFAGVGTALLDENGRILEENPYLSALLGGSVIGKAPWQFTHAADREPWKTAFFRLAEKGEPRHDMEVRLHRSGGEVVWTQSCLVVFPIRDGDQARYLLTVADTTHRRVAEMLGFLENERRGLAAEIHDELAQSISALHMLLSGAPHEDPRVERATRLANQIVDNASSLMASLRSPLAEGVDLLSALRELVTRFSIDEEVDINVEWPAVEPALTDLHALVLYRVVQEGLANIAKHAQANLVTLSLKEQDGFFNVELSDDGCGFDVGITTSLREPNRHFGLRSIKERCDMVNASLFLHSEIGKGTRLHLRLPGASSGAIPDAGHHADKAEVLERARKTGPLFQRLLIKSLEAMG